MLLDVCRAVPLRRDRGPGSLVRQGPGARRVLHRAQGRPGADTPARPRLHDKRRDDRGVRQQAHPAPRRPDGRRRPGEGRRRASAHGVRPFARQKDVRRPRRGRPPAGLQRGRDVRRPGRPPSQLEPAAARDGPGERPDGTHSPSCRGTGRSSGASVESAWWSARISASVGTSSR